MFQNIKQRVQDAAQHVTVDNAKALVTGTAAAVLGFAKIIITH